MPEPSEVTDLVEQARSTFLGGGGRHGIVVDLPVDLPRAMADHRRVVQVLNNLLANAARHAPETSSIRVSAVREDAHVAVSVADEGRGVAPERVGQLFNKHAGAGETAGAGHGLGLAICKGLVEAHGGRIQAKSPGVGRGTTVTVHASGRQRDWRRSGRLSAAGQPGKKGDADAHPGRRRRPAHACASYATRWPRAATPRW